MNRDYQQSEVASPTMSARGVLGRGPSGDHPDHEAVLERRARQEANV